MSFRFEDALTIGRHLIDPRGRCDRRAMFYSSVGLLVATVVLGALFGLFGADLTGRPFLALNLVLTWAFACTTIKRMHDLGRSGWWIVAAFAFWIVGSFVFVAAISMAVGPTVFQAALVAHPMLMVVLVIAMSLPPFGGLLWIKATAGDAKTNRFGRVPHEFGFSAGLPKHRASVLAETSAAAA